jgi:hypothetical protein
MVNLRNLEIIMTAFGNGSIHDFRLFKENYAGLAHETLCLADTGYLGIHKLHANSQIPAKKSKLHPLTPEQKAAKSMNFEPNPDFCQRSNIYFQR